MKSAYLYIEAGLQIDLSTQFYRVRLGASPSDKKHYAWLAAYAAEHGHFFVLWSNDVREFLDRCLQSINRPVTYLMDVEPETLQDALSCGSEVPVTYEAELSRQRLLAQIDPAFYASQVITQMKAKKGAKQV